MANVFDQFDDPSATPAGNVFDQFDDRPAVSAAAVAPQPEPSVIGDVVKSIPSGVVRSNVELGMLPITAANGLKSGRWWLGDKFEDAMAGWLGIKPQTPEQHAQERAALEDGSIGQSLVAARDRVRAGMDMTLHKPETTAGRYAETIGEFVGPGSVTSKAVRSAPTLGRAAITLGREALGNVVAPALASETAGEIADSSGNAEWSPYARIIGALFGNAGTAAVRSYNAPEAIVRRATSDMTPDQWQRAIELQNNPLGVRLTGPEAITQATDGASALPNVQRVVEGTTVGRSRTAPFFAARPGQVDAAVGSTLDKIGAQDPAPSTLGPRVSQAAQRAMTNTPEGQTLVDAVFGAGPRTTPLQAGQVIQPALRGVYDGREGMRNALADRDYQAARTAPPTVPVEGLQPETTTTQPAYTSIRPTGPAGAPNAMTPVQVPAQTQTPALTSRTGPQNIQVDARGVVQAIDNLAPNARAVTQDALQRVRGMLFEHGGVDTSVNGLDATRGQIGDMINAARREGQTQTTAALLQVQGELDRALGSVPAYANARQGFENASRPLDPFQSPGMDLAVSRDEYNRNFTTPPEQVPGALMTPAESRNFNAVAPPDARVAMGNRIATELMDKATDANGAVSADKLALALRDNQDLLTQFPEVAQRLQGVITADTGMATRRAGPLGKLSNAADTNTATAADTILPPNPMVGSATESADLVKALFGEDPQATASLIRQNLADRFSQATTETMEGNREFSGGKFHKDVAGNPARRQVLDSVLQALPGAPNVDVSELLDVLQATARRKQIGSATSFNDSLKDEMSQGGVLSAGVGAAKTMGVNLLTRLNDGIKRSAQQRSIGSLADMFIDPRSVELIRNAASRGAPVNFAEALARTAAQGLPIASRR